MITIGGNEKQTLAVWKIKDLIEISRKEKGQCLRNALPICEHNIGMQQVHTLAVDNGTSDFNNLNLALGVEKGVKFYTVKTHEKTIEEKKATFTSNESLKNVFAIAFNGEDTIAGGDNGMLYSFRADKVSDSKVNISSSSICCMCFVPVGSSVHLAVVTEDEVLSFWEGDQLKQQVVLINQSLKKQIGTAENEGHAVGLGQKCRAKTIDHNGDGIIVVGFE